MSKEEKALALVEHIENHLEEKNIDGKVICKICDLTIDEIWELRSPNQKVIT